MEFNPWAEGQPLVAFNSERRKFDYGALNFEDGFVTPPFGNGLRTWPKRTWFQ